MRRNIYNLQTREVVVTGATLQSLCFGTSYGLLTYICIHEDILYAKHDGRYNNNGRHNKFLISYDIIQKKFMKYSRYYTFVTVYNDMLLFMYKQYYFMYKRGINIKQGKLPNRKDGSLLSSCEKYVYQNRVYVANKNVICMFEGFMEGICTVQKVIHQESNITCMVGKRNMLFVGDKRGRIRIYNLENCSCVHDIKFSNYVFQRRENEIRKLNIIDEYRFLAYYYGCFVVYEKKYVGGRYEQIRECLNELPKDIEDIIVDYVEKTEQMW